MISTRLQYVKFFIFTLIMCNKYTLQRCINLDRWSIWADSGGGGGGGVSKVETLDVHLYSLHINVNSRLHHICMITNTSMVDPPFTCSFI